MWLHINYLLLSRFKQKLWIFLIILNFLKESFSNSGAVAAKNSMIVSWIFESTSNSERLSNILSAHDQLKWAPGKAILRNLILENSFQRQQLNEIISVTTNEQRLRKAWIP